MEEKSIQSMGGEARARSLSDEKRKEIAQLAAAKRWNIPKATHEGTLRIGNIKIPCAVTENGTRLLSQAGFLRAIGRSRSPKAGTGATVAEVPTFLAASNLKPYIDNELLESTKPVRFVSVGSRIAYGYEAELLPAVCEVYLKARDARDLRASQNRIALRCDLLVRGLAHVGIVALVDEATGYEKVKYKEALQKILDRFINKEFLKWTKRFPDEFYTEMFRLKGWNFPKISTNRPQVVGHYTNDVVYDRLAPGVLSELRRVDPPDEKGNRPQKFHQWLTPDWGNPILRDHLVGVISLMKAADSWGQFKRLLGKAYPKKGDTIELDFKE